MSKKRAIRALCNHPRRLAALGGAVEIVAPGRYDPRVFQRAAPRLPTITRQAIERAILDVQRAGAERWKWAGAVDGWPADNFYAVVWQFMRPDRAQTINKALDAANGPDTRYRMRHAFTPDWFAPVWDPTGKGGDCSGFVSFCLDRDKDGGDDWQNKRKQDRWLHTGSIWTDARGPRELFREIAKPEPGCIFTYPDRPKSKGGGQGHTGFILTVDADTGAMTGADCSYKQGKAGDAITVRDMGWTLSDYARKRRLIFCVPAWWTDQEGV